MVDSQPDIGNQDSAKRLDELEGYERDGSKKVLELKEQNGFDDNYEESGKVAIRKVRGPRTLKMNSKMLTATEIKSNQAADED